MILGWVFDSRRLLIKLPQEKLADWLAEIDELLKKTGYDPGQMN